jgi:hypothetical protein
VGDNVIDIQSSASGYHDSNCMSPSKEMDIIGGGRNIYHFVSSSY